MENKSINSKQKNLRQFRETHPEEMLIAELISTAKRYFPHGLPRTFDLFAGELTKRRASVAEDLSLSVGSECAAAYTHLSDTTKRKLWMSVWLAAASEAPAC